MMREINKTADIIAGDGTIITKFDDQTRTIASQNVSEIIVRDHVIKAR